MRQHHLVLTPGITLFSKASTVVVVVVVVTLAASLGEWQRKSRVRGTALRFRRHIAMPRGYQQRQGVFGASKFEIPLRSPIPCPILASRVDLASDYASVHAVVCSWLLLRVWNC